ncbi:MAG: hypothetical protein IT461_00900 [Planctomycetes bacterium]|jgi:hypothetical protein|nr:hypothetical protein [Planctomycetota bacterium]
MMHPWDRERSATDKPGFNWLSILMAILLGLFGFAMAAKLHHGGRGPLVVPVVFAGVGALYFLVRGFKGGGCCSAPRASWRDDAPIATGQPMTPPSQSAGVVAPPGYSYTPKEAARDNLALRRVYDRFDLLAIERAKRQGLTPGEQASFLNFARDYVDVDHSLALLAERDETELKQHFMASLERALLAFQNQPPV